MRGPLPSGPTSLTKGCTRFVQSERTCPLGAGKAAEPLGLAERGGPGGRRRAAWAQPQSLRHRLPSFHLTGETKLDRKPLVSGLGRVGAQETGPKFRAPVSGAVSSAPSWALKLDTVVPTPSPPALTCRAQSPASSTPTGPLGTGSAGLGRHRPCCFSPGLASRNTGEGEEEPPSARPILSTSPATRPSTELGYPGSL